MSRVTVMAYVCSRRAVAGMRTDRFVIVVRGVVHFEFWS